MIQKTYVDGNPEDRNAIEDFWSWLRDQPQDAWLLWARNANWDNAEPVFEEMVASPDCDLAIVSWLFWTASPAFYVGNAGSLQSNALMRTILANTAQGVYRRADLFYDRYEVIHPAHEYLAALRDTATAEAAFQLPRALCGPFDGRKANLPARYDAQTEADLQEIFRTIDGSLPRSEAAHWQDQVNGGNVAIKDHLPLPNVPTDPVSALRSLDDAAYVEAIFASADDYEAARSALYSGRRKRLTAPARRSWWPFG